MAFQIGVELAQGQQVLAREEPSFRPGRVKDRSSVPLRQHEHIIFSAVRLLRVIPHDREEQRRDNLSGRCATGRVPATCRSCGTN